MLLFLFLLFAPFISSQPCYKNCNSNGICMEPSRQCKCFKGYTGADCSLRVCPFGPAWTDQATAVDRAHNPAECSNMGTCDRIFGTCSCRLGFEGIACQRKSCPFECNGRGKCLSMFQYARTKDLGLGTRFTYASNWDANMMYGCMCDDHYHGPDCSMKWCPLGDDPLTGNGVRGDLKDPMQESEIQSITCAADAGTFTLTYDGKTTQPIAFNARLSVVQAALEALPTIGTYSSLPAINMQKVLVKMPFSSQPCLPAGVTWTVQFLQQFGTLPNIVPSKLGLTNGGLAANAVLRVDKTTPGTKEAAQCSNRGTCDTVFGRCSCSLNFDTSNGYGLVGTRGDCGNPTSTIQFCPGAVSCSGHGECSGAPKYTCSCQVGWTAGDCSERLCPTGHSWFELPTANEEAHINTLTECSDMGLCDPITGTCACVEGFYGSACEYHKCPGAISPCNGHGQCYDMSTLAALSTINGELAQVSYGLTPGDPKTWDAQRSFGCFCHADYRGYDCSERNCPYGDDPITVHQADEVQRIYCKDPDLLGTVYFLFRQGQSVSISATSTSAEVKAALEAVSTVGTVSVEPWAENGIDQLCTVSGNQLVVTFLTTHGDVPMLKFSQLGIESFLVEEMVPGTKEVLECSGRGNCDRITGNCVCFEGFGSSDGMGNQGIIGDCGFQEPIALSYAEN